MTKKKVQQTLSPIFIISLDENNQKKNVKENRVGCDCVSEVKWGFLNKGHIKY